MGPTFRYRAFHGWHVDQPLNDHDDRHFRKFPLRPAANAYGMNDAMNGHRAMHDYAYDYDANDDRMSVSNVANAVDALDDGFALDVYIFHKQNDSPLLVAVDI